VTKQGIEDCKINGLIGNKIAENLPYSTSLTSLTISNSFLINIIENCDLTEDAPEILFKHIAECKPIKTLNFCISIIRIE